jgi:hypothetical protein
LLTNRLPFAAMQGTAKSCRSYETAPEPDSDRLLTGHSPLSTTQSEAGHVLWLATQGSP